MFVRIVLVCLLFGFPLLGQSFSEQLWERIEPIYAETLRHPFLAGLTSGELPREKFEFYIEQDALYLGAFSRALSLLAAKAPREEWSLLLNRHAVEALEVERALHESMLGGRRPGEMAPSTRAYTNHLISTVLQRPFAEGLAAMLPCYWIYWEVGRALERQGSDNADYQRWIDQYSSEAYETTVRQVLAIMDTVAEILSPAAVEACHRWFEISARYEYMFWDMAWREEQWPPTRVDR